VTKDLECLRIQKAYVIPVVASDARKTFEFWDPEPKDYSKMMMPVT
jgi:hypothetical protein